jgi:uncharacterized RDD family membrane protein YckC
MAEDYTLLTPETVERRSDVAGAGSRLTAAAIDYAILSCGYAVLALGGGFAFAYLASFLDRLSVGRGDLATPITFVGGAVIIIVTFFLWWGYFVLFELLWNGQSPGKRWLGLRVLRLDGQPVTAGASLIRNLLRVVDVGLSVGPIVMVVDRRGRRLGDFAAGTLVVREPKEVGGDVAAALTAPAVPPVSGNAVLALPNVDRLGPREYAVLREYFARRPRLPPDAADRLAARLAGDLARVLDADASDSANPTLFLATALRAYEARRLAGGDE